MRARTKLCVQIPPFVFYITSPGLLASASPKLNDFYARRKITMGVFIFVYINFRAISLITPLVCRQPRPLENPEQYDSLEDRKDVPYIGFSPSAIRIINDRFL